MNITTKGRYALRVMADLAMHRDEGYVSLSAVSERQQLSVKYLEMIVGHLKKAGLIESSRGKDGGYMQNISYLTPRYSRPQPVSVKPHFR